MKKFLFTVSLLTVSNVCFADFNVRRLIFGSTQAEKLADCTAEIGGLSKAERQEVQQVFERISKGCPEVNPDQERELHDARSTCIAWHLHDVFRGHPKLVNLDTSKIESSARERFHRAGQDFINQ